VKKSLVGNVIAVKARQSWKMLLPIVVTESGIIIFVIDVFWNALSPIVVTDSGIVIFVIDTQP